MEDPQDDHEDREEPTLDGLRGRLDTVQGFQEHIVKGQLMEKVDNLVDRVESLEAELESERAHREELEARIDMLAGLADDEQSTPAKRAADLREILIRRARTRDGKAEMTKDDIIDGLADLGHESIYAHQAYTAMEDAAETDGFFEATTTSKHGNEVRCIRVNLDRVPGHGAVIENNNSEKTAAAGEE